MTAQSLQSGHGPTEADRALAREASKLTAVPVTAWQVKRWREAGLLPTTRRYLGRGRGSEPAAFRLEAPAHAACLAETLKKYPRLGDACLVCFMRGFAP